MLVYRIAKSVQRANELSGIGAFKNGGRWNSKGTYMLFTSANSSLAYLETLVHFNEPDVPPGLFIASIEIKSAAKLIYELPDKEYPAYWQAQENLENKMLGDRWMHENKFLAFKIRSAINPSEYNFLLNPLFPRFRDKVITRSVEQLNIDTRLIR